MSDADAVLVPIDQLTKKQMLRFLTRGHIAMTDAVSHLEQSVETQTQQSAAWLAEIQDLRSQLGGALADKDAAIAGEAEATRKLADAVQAADAFAARVEAQADKLDADDPAAADAGTGDSA